MVGARYTENVMGCRLKPNASVPLLAKRSLQWLTSR